MSTCYILVWISPELLFTDAGTYGEGPDTITVVDTKDTPIELLKADGRDYEKARHNVLEELAARAQYGRGIWPKVKAMVDADIRRNRRNWDRR